MRIEDLIDLKKSLNDKIYNTDVDLKSLKDKMECKDFDNSKLDEIEKQIKSKIEEKKLIQEELQKIEVAIKDHENTGKEIKKMNNNKALDPKQDLKYFESEEYAVKYFKELLNVKTKADREGFKTKMVEDLESKSITGLADLTPPMFMQEVKDYFANYTGLLNYVDHRPVTWTRIAGQTNKGFGNYRGQVGDAAQSTNKTVENLAFETFNLVVGEFYKFVQIEWLTQYLDQQNGGYVNRYIMREIVEGLVRIVELGIINQGSALNTSGAMTPALYDILTSKGSPNGDMVVVGSTVDVSAATFGLEQLQAIYSNLSLMLGTGRRLVICTMTIAEKIKNAATTLAWLNPQYAGPVDYGLQRLTNEIEAFVVEDAWLLTSTGTYANTTPIIGLRDQAYLTIGMNPANPQIVDQFIINPLNTRDIEAIIAFGGAMQQYHGAVIMPVTMPTTTP